MADTFDFVDTAGNGWTFFAPEGQSATWAGALKQAAYGQPAGRRIIAGVSSDALALEANAYANGERTKPGGTLDVNAPAPAKSSGGGLFFLFVVMLLLSKKGRR